MSASMTSDRRRKQAIRQRMAEADEPYSVAARHVDEERAARRQASAGPASEAEEDGDELRD